MTFEQLHHDEVPALVFVNVVDGADMRVIQRGCGAGFALEAFEGRRVGGWLLGQEFQRHVPAKLGVLGHVHDSHAAATQFFDNAVVRDGLPDHGG